MLQLSSIAVPLDGSSFAEQALPLASRLARSSSATLRLALVHTPASTWDPGVEFSLFDPDVEVQVQPDIRRPVPLALIFPGDSNSVGSLTQEIDFTCSGSGIDAHGDFVRQQNG